MVPTSELRPFFERILATLDDPDGADLFAADADVILAELYAGRDPHALFALERRAYNEFADPVQLTLQVLNLLLATFKVVKEYSAPARKPEANVDEIASKWEAAMMAHGIPADKATLLALKFQNDLRSLVHK